MNEARPTRLIETSAEGGKTMSTGTSLVTVFCASSRQCAREYHDAARKLGRVLATHGVTIAYGGGAIGSMGALADGALSCGGRVIGVLPRFMHELEWGHKGLSELHLVDDMRQRKERMLEGSRGVVALPGGCGTLEELFEAITLKRLGLFVHPIILVNTRRFFDPLLQLLSSAITEHFMDERHGAMWQVVPEPEDVPGALASAPPWSSDARNFAVPGGAITKGQEPTREPPSVTRSEVGVASSHDRATRIGRRPHRE